MPSKFQYQGKSIFLTYSQCPIDKEVMLEHLKERVKNTQLKKACIGQERHEDGEFHLHVCAWYTNTLKFTDPGYLDILGEDGVKYHPNISGKQVKNRQKALAYCSKEDPDPLCYNMDIKEETKARECKRKILGKRLLDGEPLHELAQEDPSLLFGYNKLKQDLAAYHRDKAEAKPDLPKTLPNPWNKELPVHTDRK